MTVLTVSAQVEVDRLFSEARADDPLWEIGLFNAFVTLPKYRGSSEYNVYAVPLPYMIYRGDVLQADRDNVRGLFFEAGRFALDVSVLATVNDDDSVREGMPPLATFLFEAGPELKCTLVQDPPSASQLYLSLLVRGALGIGSDRTLDSSYEGLNARLHLNFLNRRMFGNDAIEFGASLGVAAADRDFNAYYYTVAPRFETAGRPAYEARSGYAGLSASATLLVRLNRSLALRTYVRWENLSGSVFADSPLVSTENNLTMLMALAWTLLESNEKAHRPLSGAL